MIIVLILSVINHFIRIRSNLVANTFRLLRISFILVWTNELKFTHQVHRHWLPGYNSWQKNLPAPFKLSESIKMKSEAVRKKNADRFIKWSFQNIFAGIFLGNITHRMDNWVQANSIHLSSVKCIELDFLFNQN